jgi:hypothetical protein
MTLRHMQGEKECIQAFNWDKKEEKAHASSSFLSADLVFLFRILLRGKRNESQDVSGLAIQHGTHSGKNVCIKSCQTVFTVIVDLGPLHVRQLAEFFLTYFSVSKQFFQVNCNLSVCFHTTLPLLKNVRINLTY